MNPGRSIRGTSFRPKLVQLFVSIVPLIAAGCAFTPLSESSSPMSLAVGEDALIQRAAEDGGPVLRVSLVRLICQPERYHGRRVQIRGYLRCEFEGNHLCLSSESSGLECLWLEVAGAKDPGFREGFGSVEGTFDGERRGHFACCSGTIQSITRVFK